MKLSPALLPLALSAFASVAACSSGGTTSSGLPGDASTATSGDGGTTPPEAGDDGGGGTPADASSDSSSSGPTKTPTEALCDRVVGECKNTYYKDAADCVKQSLDYWGTCPARITALDAYSACIGKLPCSTIGGSYNPSSTPCASLYTALASTKCN